MERIKLKVTPRQERGKELAKKLRRDGLVPAVVYKGKTCHSIKISARELMAAVHTKAGENVIIDLVLEDAAKGKEKAPGKKTRTAIIKEIQYHPVKSQILHVDFNEISLSENLTVKVPIAAKGEAQGIKEGGILEHSLWEIEIECLPTQIPENIPVDVSPLKIGDSILVKDLQIPAGIKVLTDPQATVISLALPKAEEEELKPEEELAEPEVIMEKKPEEEEAPADQPGDQEPEKEKKE